MRGGFRTGAMIGPVDVVETGRGSGAFFSSPRCVRLRW